MALFTDIKNDNIHQQAVKAPSGLWEEQRLRLSSFSDADKEMLMYLPFSSREDDTILAQIRHCLYNGTKLRLSDESSANCSDASILRQIRCINYEQLTKSTPAPEAAHQSCPVCQQSALTLNTKEKEACHVWHDELKVWSWPGAPARRLAQKRPGNKQSLKRLTDTQRAQTSPTHQTAEKRARSLVLLEELASKHGKAVAIVPLAGYCSHCQYQSIGGAVTQLSLCSPSMQPAV
ncbi:hypothetical protein PO909_019134 [Leuciscus waleckii]